MFFISASMLAQTDSVVVNEANKNIPTVDNPDDWYSKELPHDLNPQKDWERVYAEDLPPKLVKILQNEPQYQGWEEQPVYLDKNTGLYHVRLVDANEVRKYGFDKKGHVVTVDANKKPQ